MVGSSQILALAVALPVGVYAAMRPYSIFDQIANTVAFIGFSLPTFFTGLLLILIFSVNLGWLPFVYRTDIAATGWLWYWENFKQAIMPVTVLGLFQAASYTRYVRSAVLDVIRLDYVTTARSKGLGEGKVIVKHVVRNALIPVVTLVALQMPAVFGGAIVTEQIFRIPGIGSLLIIIDSRQRHARHHGGDVRVRLSRRRLQPSWPISSMAGLTHASPTADAVPLQGRRRRDLARPRGVAKVSPPPHGGRERGDPDGADVGGPVRAADLAGADQRNRFHRAAQPRRPGSTRSAPTISARICWRACCMAGAFRSRSVSRRWRSPSSSAF